MSSLTNDVRIIESSSNKGNCYFYFDNKIMVDFGNQIAMYKIREYLKDTLALFLTHIDYDHTDTSILKTIMREFPRIKVFGNQQTVDKCLEDGFVINLIEPMQKVRIPTKDYEIVATPINLYHDEHIDNFGYYFEKTRIDFNILVKNLFHATDTGTLDGINIPKCDILCVECNHNEELVLEKLAKAPLGDYANVLLPRVLETHLNNNKFWEFVNKFKKEDSIIFGLHPSNSNIDWKNLSKEEEKIFEWRTNE